MKEQATVNKESDFLTLTLGMSDSADIVNMFQNCAKPGKKIYIITGSQWNDLLPYIDRLERQGFTVTNTAFQDYATEMRHAETVVYLRGWGGTAIGRKMNEMRKDLALPVTERKTVYIGEHELPPVYGNFKVSQDLQEYQKSAGITVKINRTSIAAPLKPKRSPSQNAGLLNFRNLKSASI